MSTKKLPYVYVSVYIFYSTPGFLIYIGSTIWSKHTNPTVRRSTEPANNTTRNIFIFLLEAYMLYVVNI